MPVIAQVEVVSLPIWAQILVGSGPIALGAFAYLVWYIFWGRDKQLAAEERRLTMQLDSEERKEATRAASEERKAAVFAKAIEALAASLEKHSEVDDRRFSELVHQGNRQTSMLRELPGAIGEATRLKDDMLFGSKGDGGNV